jgi:LacI family transcriptional regulator, galactose operon repressor
MVDVAREAGRSKSTVSAVIRGEPHITPETRKRVLDAIDKLGYRRNAAARYLARQRSDALGVVVGDFRNPFHAEMAILVEQEAAKRGYTTLLATTGDDEEVQAARIRVLLEHRVAAIIFLAFAGPKRALAQIPKDTAAVFVGFQTALGPSVSVDEATGTSLVITHLVNLGHTRIGYVTITGAAERYTEQPRLHTYQQVLEQTGLTYDERLVLQVSASDANGGPGDAHARLQQYLTRHERPTAIFAASDYTALEIIECADQLGIAIPRDLSLVGFDDIATAGTTRISLTTVAQPFRELAAEGVEAAIARIEGRQAKPRLLTPQLVVRNSTGPPPKPRG